jgi:hypothetical protein
MILNANDYRINIKSIKLLFDTKEEYSKKLDFIGSVAIATAVPIVVVCYYMGELYGFTDELNAKIDRLRQFYKITEMRGI